MSQWLEMRIRDKGFWWRILLLLVCLLAGLVLINTAQSLFDVWQLDTGAPVPGPWNGLFDTSRASQRSDTLALLGAALLGGAGAAALVFVLERVLKGLSRLVQATLRK